MKSGTKTTGNHQSEIFSRHLLDWYQRHKRDLPWRKTHDPYRIWISEIMLQQTTVNAVIPYYERWLEIFPDVKALARARLQTVLKMWQGLGYYERARNLHTAAKIFVNKYEGKIPAEYEKLDKIPGFGPYTTAAVLSLAFHKPHPVLDANVRRVMMRILGIHGEANGHHDQSILAELQTIISIKSAGSFNQALMELGALICKARNPLCLLCPVQPLCRAFKRGEQEIIPKPKKRTYRRVEAVVGIIEKDGRFLIQKRPATGLLAGLWEFPGGKVKRGETREKAVAREIREELGAEVAQATFLVKVNHSYTQFQVDLYAYACRLRMDPAPNSGRQKWVRIKDLRKYPFPSGSAKIIQFLENMRE
jgi:A/G-specific adenine glycosylase